MSQGIQEFNYADFEKIARDLIFQKTGRRLTSKQAIILKGFFDDLSYEAMGMEYSFSRYSLKSAGATLLQEISSALGSKVKKGTVVQELKAYFIKHGVEQKANVSVSSETNATKKLEHGPLAKVPVKDIEPSAPTRDYLDYLFPDAKDPFIGHQALVLEVLTHINEAQYQLIILHGIVKIGKTAFLRTVVNQLKSPPHILYQQASNLPTLFDFYKEVLLFFNETPKDKPTNPSHEIIRCLSSHRCIIIVDGIEQWFQEKKLASEYKKTASEYLQLFQEVAGIRHKSCVILAGRCKPNGLKGSHNTSNTYIRKIPYLSAETLKDLIKSRYALEGTESQWKNFLQEYGYNTGLLITQASDIKDYDAGQLRYLQESDDRSDNIKNWLSQAVRDCSEAELKVLYWLYLFDGDESELKRLAFFPHRTPRLEQCLRSLKDRSFIDRSIVKGRIHIELPLLKRFVVEELINILVGEIINNRPKLIHYVPIALSVGYEYVRLRRKGLKLLAEDLTKAFEGNKDEIQKAFSALLNNIRISPEKDIGYGAGTILNVALELKLDISVLDFRELSLQQADLRNLRLAGVDLAGCNASDIAFSQGLFGKVVVAVSTDGTLLAAGDALGTLMIWHDDGKKFQLALYRSYEEQIVGLSFVKGFPLIVATNQGKMYSLNGLEGHRQKTFRDFGYCYCCLAVSPDGRFIATGDTGSDIYVWSTKTNRCKKLLRIHTGHIEYLAFSPDSKQLVSFSGEDMNRLIVWDLETRRPRTEQIRNSNYWISGISWHALDNTINIVENSYRHIAIQTIGGNRFGPFKECEKVYKVALTSNGKLCATCSNELEQVTIWDVNSKKRLIVLNAVSYPVTELLFVGNDEVLLICSDIPHCGFEISLWRVEDGECLETMRGFPVEKKNNNRPYENLNLQGVTGLSEAQVKNLRSLGSINSRVVL